MYNGIGLNTPRGSGTNGYVQRNLAFVRDDVKKSRIQYSQREVQRNKPENREPNKDIIEHERKRQLEVRVLEWAAKTGILDRGLPDDELEQLLQNKREEFTKQEATSKDHDRGQIRLTETHQRNQQKQKESEKMRDALGISSEYGSGMFG